MKIARICWMDSGSVDGIVWQFKDDWSCPIHECESVGYVIESNKLKVVIAQSVNDDQYGRLFAIPKDSIISMEYLEGTK